MLQRLVRQRRWIALAVVMVFALGGFGVFIVFTLSTPAREAWAAVTVATPPADLRHVTDFTPGSTTGEPLLGFALTATSSERLANVVFRIDAPAGSTFTASDIQAVMVLKDDASPSADIGEGPFDDYSSGSLPTDNANRDDLLASIGGGSITLGASTTLAVGTAANTAGKSTIPASMSGRGSYEYQVWVSVKSGVTDTTDQFTLTIESLTCGTSDGSGGGTCGSFQNITSHTIGAPGWMPSGTSNTIAVAASPTDLGVGGFRPGGTSVPYLGFALTSSTSEQLASVTLQLNTVTGSTIHASDFNTVTLIRDSAVLETDWFGTTDDYVTVSSPTDVGTVAKTSDEERYILLMERKLDLNLTFAMRQPQKS